MRPRLVAAATAAVALMGSAPAHAFGLDIVSDPGAYARFAAELQELQRHYVTLQQQLNQGKQLYDDFNKLTNVNSIANVLNNPALRQYLPPEVRDTSRLLNGSLSDLGSIGTRATAIRDANRLFAPATSGLSASEQYYQNALVKSGDRAARDIALGESAYTTATQRQAGLDELRLQLNKASTAKEVMDLQARIAAEQALINNDQMQLQGLTMMQEAERRMAEQRDREELAVRNRQTMQDYKAGFQ